MTERSILSQTYFFSFTSGCLFSRFFAVPRSDRNMQG